MMQRKLIASLLKMTSQSRFGYSLMNQNTLYLTNFRRQAFSSNFEEAEVSSNFEQPEEAIMNQIDPVSDIHDIISEDIASSDIISPAFKEEWVQMKTIGGVSKFLEQNQANLTQLQLLQVLQKLNNICQKTSYTRDQLD